MLITVGIAVIVILTLMTGYFVAQEFAYVSVDRGKLRQLADRGDAAAERALKVTSRLSFTLSGAQFGITVTALLVGFLGEELVVNGLSEGYADSGPLARAAMISLFSAGTLAFSTILQMVIGELAPKNWAISQPVRLALALSRSTLLYLTIFGPIITLFDKASNALLRSVGIEPVQELPQGATPEDLTRIIAESHSGGTLDEELSLLLVRGLAFRDRVAEEVMTPRTSVQTIQADETAAVVLGALETGHSRFPVVGRDIDDIVGVVGLHDLLQVDAVDRPNALVRDIADDALILPESLPLPKVLEALRESHTQMAVVVDEYGGFAGVLTMEDLAEELVGEITDEHDVETPEQIVAGEEDEWRMDGDVHVDEVERALGHRLPEGDYETIAGLLIAQTGDLPEVGEVVNVELPQDPSELVADEPMLRSLAVEVLEVERHVPSEVCVRLITRSADEVVPVPEGRGRGEEEAR